VHDTNRTIPQVTGQYRGYTVVLTVVSGSEVG
jgi:hypothetical protein